MSTYTKELELLILDTLLPVYIKDQKAKGNKNPLKGIHQELLNQIKHKAVLPALLRPIEKQS